jgi:cell division transport system permease protein
MVMIAVAVMILTFFILLTFNTKLLLQALGAQAKVVVFLKDEAQPEQRQAIEATLRSVAGAEDVQYISKAQAWRDLIDWFPESSRFLADSAPNPLPASFVLQLTPQAQVDAFLPPLKARLSRLSGIDEVEYGTQWRQGFQAVRQVVRLMSLAGGIVLGFGIAIIMASTTRLTLYAHSYDVEVMQLIGATDRFISAPFLLVGIIQSLVGAVLGLSLVFVLHCTIVASLSTMLSEISGLPPLRFLPWPILSGILGGSLGLGYLGSALALYRMLRTLPIAP